MNVRETQMEGKIPEGMTAEAFAALSLAEKETARGIDAMTSLPDPEEDDAFVPRTAEEIDASIDGRGPDPGDFDPAAPTDDTLEEWMDEGGAEATDGCWVEPDGTCEHGKPSWLIVLGLI